MLKWLNRLNYFFDMERVKRKFDACISSEDEDDLLEEEFLHIKLPQLSQDDLAGFFDLESELEPAACSHKKK